MPHAFCTLLVLLLTAAQTCTSLCIPWRMTASLNSIRLRYEFPNTPLIQGIQHIHSVEHLCTVHKLAAPCFRLKKVHPPKLTADSSSVLFECSTLLADDMLAIMFTTRPTESNILFVAGKRMVYNIQLTVKPIPSADGRLGDSHSLKVDVTFFLKKGPLAAIVHAFLPLYLRMQETELLRGSTEQPNPNLLAYRNWVMRGIVNLL